MKVPWLRPLRSAALGLLGRPLVLLYHRIASVEFDPWVLCVSAEHFEQQLEWLGKRKVVMPLALLVEAARAGRAPRHAVAITFDDGYADNLHCARPLLEDHGMPATFFLTVRNITRQREYWWDELGRILVESVGLPGEVRLEAEGAEARWRVPHGRDARISLYWTVWARLRALDDSGRERALDGLAAAAGLDRRPRRSHRPLRVDEVRELAAGHGMSIGAHTLTHPMLTDLAEPDQVTEVRGAKAELEALLGTPVTTFSYPYGAHGPDTARIVREAGFACACTTWAGALRRRMDPYRLPRLVIEDWDGPTFARRLALAG